MLIKLPSILKRPVCSLLVITAIAAGAFSQEKPDEPIKIDTNLIQTDVTVTDKAGRFIDGLTPEQFVLKIDGKPVKIDFFDKVVSYADENRESAQKDPQSGPLISLRERHIVFFLDDVHLSLDSLGRTRSAISHFIDKDMMPQDQVGIFTSSGNLGFLQQFTNNKAVLRIALAKLRAVPSAVRDGDSPPMSEYIAVRILNGDVGAANIYIDKILEAYNTKMVQPLTRAAALDMVKVRANNIVTIMTSTTKNTLGSLENVLQSATVYKGRKIFFLFSDGFYLETKQVPYSTTEVLQRAINRATRAGASIYTIDARGLFTLMGGDAAGERAADMTSRGLDRARAGEAADSQLGLFSLANETGGKFLKNQNYFERWVDRVIDENSSYYVLAWTPEKDEQLSKKFKSIDVDIVGRDDLKVRQQRGYLTSWEKPGSKEKENTAAAKEAVSGKPLPTVLAVSYLDVPNVGGIVNSSVQIAIGGLDYGEKNDKPAALGLSGFIFDQEGKQAGSFKTGLTVAPPGEGKEAPAEQSVIYTDKTPLKPGIYLIRVGIREGKTGSTGMASQWIEIPDLSKNQLTMGSLFLGGQAVGSGAGAANSAAQVQFSVDHNFGRPISLDFMSFVYNAARGGSGEVNLATRVEVLGVDGQMLIDTDLRPLATKGNPDMGRIPVRGSIKQQTISPGNYLLRITVADNIANTKTVQQEFFTIK